MSAFFDNLKKYLPVIEQGLNVGLLVSGVGAPFEPLAVGLENALNPLLQSLGTPQTASGAAANVYAAIIGVLETLKATPGLPAATLAQIEAYVTAAQAGLAGYMQASTGFNPANYQPVTPIP